MRLLTPEIDEVLGVAERWKAQYCKKGQWGGSRDGHEEDTFNSLAALKRGATAADVVAIIGNDRWVGQDCTECGEHRAIVLVGQEPDYESYTVYLCAPCIKRLQDFIPAGTGPEA